ncbi:SPOR domain-containing protein [Streptomyces sp. NBC_00080]|uniref:SPOR domain-containing protein n=1 Tax=Streptomyces TaxID=1883 RepID=UPI001152F3DF|nr:MULTISPECIES: SPOR domain-containing protein [Streptomyces]
MNDSTISLPWLVIRQDDNGNRYRVGRYATRAEAQKTADSLDSRGHKQLYWVERIGQGQAQAQAQNGDGTLN